MREDETEKAFMKPNEDDNDVVSVSDDTQDEQLFIKSHNKGGSDLA